LCVGCGGGFVSGGCPQNPGRGVVGQKKTHNAICTPAPKKNSQVPVPLKWGGFENTKGPPAMTEGGKTKFLFRQRKRVTMIKGPTKRFNPGKKKSNPKCCPPQKTFLKRGTPKETQKRPPNPRGDSKKGRGNNIYPNPFGPTPKGKLPKGRGKAK